VANAFGGKSNAGSITIYAPPYTGAPLTIANGIDNPGAIALDPSGNLWVANQAGSGLNGSVAEYAPPFGGGPVRTIANFTGVPTGLSFDAQSNLFVGNGSALLEYPPPYNGNPITIASSLSVANGFTLDSTGNLYYVDSNGATSLFTPPYTQPPMQLPRVNGSLGLLATFPNGGLVFVPDASGNVQEYVAPFTAAPQGIAQSSAAARGIAVDGAGNVFVGYCGSGCGNTGTDSVTIYAAPYGTGSQSVITAGIAAPSAITLSK
jgi:streptogramin lyase